MTSAEIIARIRQLIEDPDASAYQSPEVTFQLEETLRDFTRRSRVVRKQASISHTASASLPLPIDCYEIDRLTDATGQDLTEISANSLDGYDLATIGTPTDYTRGLTGPDSITLYPIPTAAGTMTLRYIHEHVISGDAEVDIQLPERYHAAIPHGAAARLLLASSSEADQAKVNLYQGLYEAALQDATRDASRNFSSTPRVIPYRHF